MKTIYIFLSLIFSFSSCKSDRDFVKETHVFKNLKQIKNNKDPKLFEQTYFDFNRREFGYFAGLISHLESHITKNADNLIYYEYLTTHRLRRYSGLDAELFIGSDTITHSDIYRYHEQKQDKFDVKHPFFDDYDLPNLTKLVIKTETYSNNEVYLLKRIDIENPKIFLYKKIPLFHNCDCLILDVELFNNTLIFYCRDIEKNEIKHIRFSLDGSHLHDDSIDDYELNEFSPD